jgi:hypothetical protein
MWWTCSNSPSGSNEELVQWDMCLVVLLVDVHDAAACFAAMGFGIVV